MPSFPSTSVYFTVDPFSLVGCFVVDLATVYVIVEGGAAVSLDVTSSGFAGEEKEHFFNGLLKRRQ